MYCVERTIIANNTSTPDQLSSFSSGCILRMYQVGTMNINMCTGTTALLTAVLENTRTTPQLQTVVPRS